MKDQTTRHKARTLYVFNGLSAPSVASEIGVSIATIQRWKREAKNIGDDWDLARQADLTTGRGSQAVYARVLERSAALIEMAIDKVENADDLAPAETVKLLTSLADALTKLTTATGKLAPKLNELGVAQDVLRRLLEFVREHHPDAAAAIQEVIEPFGAEIAKAYG